jgi:branched-chain amino acid transport system substrate-binding protein
MSLLGRRTMFRLGSGALALGLVGTVAGVASPGPASAASSSAPGVTKTSITIGNEADLTGPFGAEFSERSLSFLAAIDAQNAKGGVYGRKIKVITEDTQSTASGTLTAAQSLVEARGVFMVAQNDATAHAAAPYLASKGIPEVEKSDPADGSLPNSFIATGSISPSPTAAATTTGLILKKMGAIKVGALGQAISPSAGAAAEGTLISAKAVGLQAGYINTTLPTVIADWTTYVLGFKNTNTDAVNPALTPQNTLAFLTAATQQGLHLKGLLDTGYDYDFLSNPATAPSMQGYYVLNPFAPSELKTPATKAEDAALKKYGHFTNPADNVTSYGYATGLLVIRGLQAAGPNPTRASFIKNLRAVKGYTANGLLPVPVNFANALKPAFQAPNTLAYGNCQWVLKVVGKNFVPTSKKPVCGKLINTASAS